MTKFYPISHDDLDSGLEILTIQTEPGVTNTGYEELSDGWLGSTNGISSYALGEFATLAEAQAVADEYGYTASPDPENPDHYDLVNYDGLILDHRDQPTVEIRVKPADDDGDESA